MSVFCKDVFLSVCGLISCLAAYSQAPVITTQGLCCEYRLTYKADSTSSFNKNELFTLSLANGLSLFRSNASVSLDSLAAAYESRPFNEQNAQLMMQDFSRLPKPAFTYSIYKKPAEHSVALYEKIGKALYFYKEPIDFLTWNVTSENLTISGYKCQKATAMLGGRKFEAWFTRDVPIADGPYKFYGLPGLIIEVHDSRRYYTFQLVKLASTPNLQVPSQPTRAVISTTKQQFEQGKTAYAGGALGRMEAMGNVLTDAEKQAYRNRVKKRNNPLELK